jgi:hypothetical protein
VVSVIAGTPTTLQADVAGRSSHFYYLSLSQKKNLNYIFTSGKVECNITGGRPAPNVAFDVSVFTNFSKSFKQRLKISLQFKTNGSKPQILNNTQKQVRYHFNYYFIFVITKLL